jgi:integrase
MGTYRVRNGRHQIIIDRVGWPKEVATFNSEPEAKRWERMVESAMDRGDWVSRKGAKATLFGDHIRDFIENETAHRSTPESVAAEKTRLERFLREEKRLCEFSLVNLTPELFEDYRKRRLQQYVQIGREGGRGRYKPQENYQKKLRKDGNPRANAAKPKPPAKPPRLISAATVKKELDLLKRVLDFRGRKLGLLINPLNSRDVKRPHVENDRVMRITPEDAGRLIAVMAKSDNPWPVLMFEFALETGARRSSLLWLKWKNLDVARSSMEIRVKNSRNPKETRIIKVGLSDRAIEIVGELLELHRQQYPDIADNQILSHLMGKPVFPITVSALKGVFERARKKIGLEDFNFHDCRHELAASMIEAGVGEITTASQTGHKDLQSLKRYANLAPSFLGDVLSKLPPKAKKYVK